jgi:hypothetical protein
MCHIFGICTHKIWISNSIEYYYLKFSSTSLIIDETTTLLYNNNNVLVHSFVDYKN